MKLQIEREQLNKGLQIVSKVITTRPSLPILSNVLLSTEKGGLRITGTDLELGITALVSAQVENEGSFTAPSKILTEFVSSNTDPMLHFEVDIQKGAQINITGENYKANIGGVPADEYPNIPEVQGNIEITINLAIFIKALRQVVVACAPDDVRPALSGVYMKFDERALVVAATDSFRLSEKIINLEADVPTKELIVPSRTVQEIVRISALLSDVENAKVIISENQIRIQIGNIDIISRLIEASFPDYQRIIPKESAVDLTVSTLEMVNALRASRIFSSIGTNNIRLEVKDQEIAVSSMASERGESKIKLKADIMRHSEEKNYQITYNGRYLSDAISSLEDEKAVLFICGPKKPTIVRSPSDPNYQHLVMPVDIKE